MDFPGGNLPGNSHQSKMSAEAKPEEPTTTETKKVKAVTDKAILRKKPVGRRFKDMFFSDTENFAQHLVENVMVPMAKDMVVSISTQIIDAVRQGIEEAIWGNSRPKNPANRGTSYSTGRPVVNYNKVSTSSTSVSRRYSPGSQRYVRRSNVLEDIILPDREEAEKVLMELDAMCDNLGHVTVGDLYNATSIESNKTDEEWGWTDLANARIRRVPNSEEVMLIMPRPIDLNN